MRFRLWHKFLLIATVPLIGCIVLPTILLQTLNQVEEQTLKEQRARDAIDECKSVTDILLRDTTQASFNIKTTGNSNDVAARWAAGQEKTAAHIKHLRQICAGNLEQLSLISKIEASFARLGDAIRVALRAPSGPPQSRIFEQIAIYKNIAREMSNVRRDFDSLKREIEDDLKKQPTAKNVYSTYVLPVILYATPIAFLVSLLTAFLLSRNVTGRLSNLSRNSEKLAQMAELLPSSGGSDEIAQLERAFAYAASQLKDAVESERASIRNARDVILTTADDGMILSANDACSALLAIEPSALVGQSLSDITSPAYRQLIAGALASVKISSDAVPVESKVSFKSGREIDVLWNLSWSAFDRCVLAVGSDISDRKLSERLLKNSEKEFQLIGDSALVGLLVVDEQGTILHSNQIAKQLLRLQSTQPSDGQLAVTSNASEFFCFRGQPISDPSAFYKVIGERTHVVDVLNGSNMKKAEISITPIELAERPRYLTIFVDVTERFQTEQMKDTLVSMIAHDIATPLTTIQTQLYLANAGMFGDIREDSQHVLRDAESESARVMRVISNVMRIAKYKPSQISERIEDVSSSDVQSLAVSIIQNELAERNIKLISETCDARICVDHEALAQAIATIVGIVANNATGETHVSETTGEAEETATLSIKCGVSENTCKFEITCDVSINDSTTRPTELSFARSIVRAHNGNIEQTSHGFSIEIPLQ